MDRPPLRAAVIGLEHPHIFSMVASVVAAGAEIVAFERRGILAEGFSKLHGGARARDRREILEDETIAFVLGAGVPCERAPLGIEVMRAGKDYVVDKAGITSLEQLAAVRHAQAETGRIYCVWFSERFESRATEAASQLVHEGAVGRVLQTIGLGPHRLRADMRPQWFFEKARYGGILTDLASHQADQFLHFTGARTARIRASQVANHAHPEFPELEDFGDMLIEGDGCSGYVRVDWFTPDGLATWGDTRLTVLGTEGTIEVRKNADIGGREGGDHLFLIDQRETRYVDCRATPLPFAGRLLDDIAARTETAMTQEHCFLACQLVLEAQDKATRIGGGGE